MSHKQKYIAALISMVVVDLIVFGLYFSNAIPMSNGVVLTAWLIVAVVGMYYVITQMRKISPDYQPNTKFEKIFISVIGIILLVMPFSILFIK
ncbi:hypothetical protein [Companilactobacillus sp.]|jgi:succinate dehydrogenase hydrophobic anchor subunit|uniref:hypothetical protein n=1 Tax=Companilactobacillus sp. TaxID=2767905 RepID=UPI0025C55B47|nr:hypothetical protein [Companilactobacillus sp.]MCH4009842.1 hypothetical protein [Companilactobacillus sp.]MCH4052482.1 hypothetical protein [Companilactobacillus sp.]MCH4077784.1 hypothetical protein [Companilactobacillus sp.]MCH4126360.1 hypothetical protein [Companilactobacillus sp.]MCI1312068.1 hypothetical protein [Companilactobacillus sp.]